MLCIFGMIQFQSTKQSNHLWKYVARSQHGHKTGEENTWKHDFLKEKKRKQSEGSADVTV